MAAGFDGTGISLVEDTDGTELERSVRERGISVSGLDPEDLQLPQGNGRLQELIESLPQSSPARLFLVNLCTLITHIRQTLAVGDSHLDFATDTHLVGVEEILAVVVQTYNRHPEDVELNTENALRAIGQIQRSMNTLQTTHPNTYQDLLEFINNAPELKDRDKDQIKRLLKQLFIGKNPKTALVSLMDFTQVATTDSTSPCEESKKDDRKSYAILAAVLGGMGIAAIGVGVAIACTGVGGPVGGGASIAGAVLLLAAGAITVGAGGVASTKLVKRTNEDVATDENEEGEELKKTNETLHHEDPLVRPENQLQAQDQQDKPQDGDKKASVSTSTSASCTSYNQLNLPALYKQ